jgi:enoyl-CoA hydratase/carnithine racemase
LTVAFELDADGIATVTLDRPDRLNEFNRDMQRELIAALDWCYSGRVFDASEAVQRRLVRSLHPPEALLPAARELAFRSVPRLRRGWLAA